MRLLIAILAALMTVASVQAAETSSKPSLKETLANLKTPPDWFGTTTVHWDMNKPWKDGRLEIRRLLGLEEAEVRQAVKITWLYAQKQDIGNGHEWPMYLFMSGNYAWATAEYAKRIPTLAGQGATHEYMCYAACLMHFGEYDQALTALERAMKDLPKPPWLINNTANIHNHYGDLYAEMGQLDQAKQHYALAIQLLPTSNQPYGRHLLPWQAAKIQTKLNLLTMQGLGTVALRDGTYVGKSLGYADGKDLEVTVTIQGGKIADVRVKHQEKIELGATRIIPQRIIEKQSLKVDVITGATVTTHAIIDGAFGALKKAGLK